MVDASKDSLAAAAEPVKVEKKKKRKLRKNLSQKLARQK
jgi:methionyl-tRNA synthetase